MTWLKLISVYLMLFTLLSLIAINGGEHISAYVLLIHALETAFVCYIFKSLATPYSKLLYGQFFEYCAYGVIAIVVMTTGGFVYFSGQQNWVIGFISFAIAIPAAYYILSVCFND